MTYEETVSALISQERRVVSEAKDILVEITNGIADHLEAINLLKSSIPDIPMYQSVVKSNIDTAFNQIQSYGIQLGYIKDSIAALDVQYSELVQDTNTSEA